MNIIRQIVTRRHVSESNLSVIRYTISRLRNKYATFSAMPRKDRRIFMEQIIKEHADNRRLYRDVTSGKL